MQPEQTTHPHDAASVEIGEEQWLEEVDVEELPARPRRRLLSPAPLALLGVLLIACGFIGGVLVEKGQNGTSGGGGGAASAFASRLKSLGGATTRGASGGVPSFTPGSTGGARPTSGTVSYVHGDTLYVSDGESGTIEVKTSAGTTITKTAKSSVKGIHPGETVTVTGSAGANGTVAAEAIRVGDSTVGFGALLGGSGGSQSSGGSSGGSSSGPALFGN